MRKLICLLVLFLTRAECAVPLEKFFPYGHGTTDQALSAGDDTSSTVQNLSIAFPFFDQLYSQLWVNVNGAISFRSRIGTYTPTCAPVNRDFSMISPFW